MRITLFVILYAVCATAHAQLSTLEVNGYAKYLFSSARYPLAAERYDDHLLHARLNTRWYPSESLKAVMEMRLRGYYGESVEHIPGFKDQVASGEQYLNLGTVLWEGKKTLGYGEVDRLYVDGNFDKLQITLGRQRIAWGTSWVWNPTDIFNPLSVLDFDYEERPAVDAARVQYYTGAVSKVEAAVRPGRNGAGTIAAACVSVNMWQYDLTLLGGVKDERWLIGAGWAGDIRGAGFRGELLVREGKTVTLPFALSVYGTDAPIYSFVLSGDYTFTNSFYVHTEVLHNSAGANDSTALFSDASRDLGALTPARWSLYQELAYDLHPLVRGSVFALVNPDDRSYAIVPSLQYSVLTDLDLTLLGMFFHGDALSEFGSYGSTVFIRAKYSF